MAVQKNKVSKAKTNSRSAHWKVSAPALSECPQCHELKRNHEVCPNCGYYKGQLIVDKKQED